MYGVRAENHLPETLAANHEYGHLRHGVCPRAPGRLLESPRGYSRDGGALMALVLVVDDDVEIQALLREALNEAGHRVVTANDGRQGLAVYRSQQPDLVITDIFMPGRSGIELALTLSRATPPPRMIVISGVAGQAFLDASAEVHVGRTFTKPFNVHEVVRAVDTLLGDRSR